MKIQLNWEQILVNSAGLRGARTTFWQPSPGEWLPAPAPGAAGWGSPLVIPQWNFSWTVAAPEWEQGGKCRSCGSLETEQGLQGQRDGGILQWMSAPVSWLCHVVPECLGEGAIFSTRLFVPR